VHLVCYGELPYVPDIAFVMPSFLDVARIILREVLRADNGGVYGVAISGGLSKYPIGQYSIRISFNADPARTQELTEATRKVIDELRMNIEQVDIVKISEAQRQSRIKDLKQNQFWMSSFISSYTNQIELEPIVQAEVLEKRLSRLNASVLKHAAKKFFNEKEVISATLYPSKT
jgi:zinc protease